MDWQIKYMKNTDTNKRLCNSISKNRQEDGKSSCRMYCPLVANQATGKDPPGSSRLISCCRIIPVKLHFPQIVVTVT